MMNRRAWHLAAVLLSSSVVPGCAGSSCSNNVIYGAPSPDGAAIAFVFHRSCGAAGGISTHVSVMAFREPLRNGAGNVLALANEQPVTVSWRSPKNLVITGFKDPVYQRSQPIGSVTVEFR